jgi:hypothetical protein
VKKISYKIIDELIRYASEMVFLDGIPAMVGITRATFYDWMRRGVREMQRREMGRKAQPSENIYCKLAAGVKKARATILMEGANKIKEAGDIDWRAMDAYLSRAFPREFGTRFRMSLSADEQIEAVLDKLEKKLEPAEFSKILQEIHDD